MSGTQMPAFAISAGGSLTDEQINVILRGYASALVAAWCFQSGTHARVQPRRERGRVAWAGKAMRSIVRLVTRFRSNKSRVRDYLALVSDQALRSIIIAGRPDIGHPDWRNDNPGTPLNDRDVTDIVAFLESLRSPTPGQPYPQHP